MDHAESLIFEFAGSDVTRHRLAATCLSVGQDYRRTILCSGFRRPADPFRGSEHCEAGVIRFIGDRRYRVFHPVGSVNYLFSIGWAARNRVIARLVLATEIFVSTMLRTCASIPSTLPRES